jgi:tripartite-type tricarboxylate transporter receptor subunit TctC
MMAQTQFRILAGSLGLAGLVALAAGMWVPAAAQDFPSKAVEIVVPVGPGGVTDRVGRALAAKLSEIWGQPVSVVNKTGGGGIVGTVAALGAKPDGYTALMYAITLGSLNPATQADLPYKWDDPTFIARTNTSPLVLYARGDLPYDTAADLIAAIKADPGKFKYASVGANGTSAFATGGVLTAAGVDLKAPAKVVYQGGALAAAAVAGGHVDFGIQNVGDVLELSSTGKIKILAVSSPSRVKELPDVPTAEEAGVAGFTLQGWNGVVGPGGVPEDVVASWQAAIDQALKDEALAAQFRDMGTEPAYLSAADFTAFVQDEYESAKAISAGSQ